MDKYKAWKQKEPNEVLECEGCAHEIVCKGIIVWFQLPCIAKIIKGK
jgi:hypothetical protein